MLCLETCSSSSVTLFRTMFVEENWTILCHLLTIELLYRINITFAIVLIFGKTALLLIPDHGAQNQSHGSIFQN